MRASSLTLRTRTIRQKVLIDASPIEVYQAYVDPKKHAAFTGERATGTARVGARFTAGDGYIAGEYVELLRGKKIVHLWTTTEWPEGYPPSKVELRLTPKLKKTELMMIHSKVPAGQARRYAEGWKKFYWEPLKEYFAER